MNQPHGQRPSTFRHRQFGPWASAIDMGPRAQLSAFWKRRMTMLAVLKRSGPRASASALFGLGCLAAMVLSTPTLLFSTAGENPAVAPSPAQGAASTIPPVASPDLSSGAIPAPTLDEEFVPRPSLREREIESRLLSLVSVDFTDEPLQSALAFLWGAAEAIPNVVIDMRGLNDGGIDLDTPVTLALQAVPRKSALRLMLDQLDLAYLIRDDVLFITTDDVAQSFVVTRVYPVADLSRDAEKLLRHVTHSVSPLSWELSGGPGVAAVTDDLGSLVILQTQENHERILELLRALRAAQRAAGGVPTAGDPVLPPPR